MQLQNAIRMKAKHEALFAKFSQRFREAQLKKWTREIESWEEDPKKENPYEEPDRCESFLIFLLIVIGSLSDSSNIPEGGYG